MSYFGADPASELWQSYLEYVDEMLVEGFFSAISHSLEFFVENMEAGPRQVPLLEARMVLNGSAVSFLPSLEREAGDGLYELVETLVGDIFKMSGTVKRVASYLEMESYQVPETFCERELFCLFVYAYNLSHTFLMYIFSFTG